MTNAWRLICDGPVDAATNMARDRAVQLAREEGSAPPTLRLYRWTRPTVTLGRFQPADAIDRGYCSEHGIDVVRRFTGGRGVLHADELTYSMVASVDDGVPRGVAASYRHLSAVLVAAFRALGVEAALTSHDGSPTSSAACYLANTRADVSAGLAKLSGSAQVWSGSTVLQHGSFVIDRDLERERAVFRLTAEQAEQLAERSATLVDLLGSRVEFDEMASAVTRAFAETMGVRLEPGDLTSRERELEDAVLASTDPDRSPVRGE